ncbi:MAG: ribonuclease Z [Ruminococcaceae bacterium]|nr:ribonuclease Z [Oscillospiraceae bacterium]
MNIFLCLDDDNGMTFGGKRQSRDKVQREKMLELCKGSRLFMNEYSANLFNDVPANVHIDEDFLNKAKREDFCFCETILPNMPEVERLYIFRWNRKYPSDLRFTGDISEFRLTYTEEFRGSSHEKISLLVYER